MRRVTPSKNVRYWYPHEHVVMQPKNCDACRALLYGAVPYFEKIIIHLKESWKSDPCNIKSHTYSTIFIITTAIDCTQAVLVRSVQACSGRCCLYVVHNKANFVCKVKNYEFSKWRRELLRSNLLACCGRGFWFEIEVRNTRMLIIKDSNPKRDASF